MGAENKGCPARAMSWAPGAACFADDEATKSPPVVGCVVQRPCASCCGCVVFMFLTLFMAIGAISSQTEDFPTTDSSGFRDRSDFTSLAMDAATLIKLEKEAQEGDDNEGMICTEGRDGLKCITDTVMPIQSEAMMRWSLILMFKRANDGNIFESEILTKIKGVVDNVLSAPGYSDYCLRKSPTAKIISAIDAAAETITISPADESIGLEEGTEMMLSDHSGTSGPGITGAAVTAIAGLDLGDENTVTLDAAESRIRQNSPTEQITAGQKLQLESKAGRTCAAQPLGEDLIVGDVTGNVLTFETPIRISDPDAQNNCVITRAPPCLALPLDTPLVVTDASSTGDSTTVTFETDITRTDATLSNCDLTATKGVCENINSPLNWLFPSPMSISGGQTMLLYDGQGSTTPTCVVDDTLVDNTCTPPCPCTSMACMCDTSVTDATAADKLDASLGIMAQSPWSLYMVGKEFAPDNRRSDVFQLTIGFGGPLCRTAEQGPIPGREGKPTKREQYCYENSQDDSEAQTKLFEDWAVEHVKKDLDEGELVKNLEEKFDVEVLYFFPIIAFQEILNVLMHDGLLAIGSVSFVFLYMYFHSSSAFIAAAGMLHIVMSFPFAFCLYRYVFGIIPVYTLSFLSIYVILAIGADDVFVFIDAWRQSARAGEEVNKNILTRMSYAYKRAAKAMLITSTTTFGAFVATATSPLGEVACFGIFTALLVLANYVFVITYFPAVLIIYHKHFENTKGCCCYVGSRKIPPAAPYIPQGTVEPAPAAEAPNPPLATAGELTNVEDTKAQPVNEDPEPQKIEVFCTEKFAPIVATPARLVFLAVTSIFAIIMITQAINLGPTTKEDQLLPDWHKFQKIINMFTHDFAQGESTPMKYNTVVWGVDNEEPVDRSGIGRFDSDDFGTLNLDSSFDLSATASQQYLVSVCDDLLSATTAVEGKNVALVRQDGGLGEREINCFMWGFEEWLSELGETFPVEPARFGPLLKQWLAEMKKAEKSKSNPRRFLPHEDYQDMIWMEGDVVKAAMIQVNTTVGRWAANYELLKEAHDAWDGWMERTNTAAPSTMNGGLFTSPETGGQAGAWVFMDTQEMLVSGATLGCTASAIVAFFVLSFSTFNPFISMLSIVNISGVLICILGMMNILGWELGVIESVSITVLVGLSVDYVVHLANSYIEADIEEIKKRHPKYQDNPSVELSPAQERELRVFGALEEMGVTVFGGACTSLGASAMLFLCWFQTFFKFGGFMFMTITTSFMFANFFFMPLLSVAGPVGKCCSFADAVNGMCGRQSKRSVDGNP